MTEMIQKNVFLLALFFSQHVSIVNAGFSQIKGAQRILSSEMLTGHFMGAAAEETKSPLSSPGLVPV